MVPMGDLIPLFFLIDLGIMVAALFDCITTESVLVRNLPKLGWIGVILILSGIGGVLWYIAGRPTPAERSAYDPHPGHPAGRGLRPNEPPDPIGAVRPSPRALAPDDDPDFLRTLSDQTRRADEERLRRWEADLRLREERLRQREDPPGDQL
jgi:Phospholipase_D-nuclease N-terminal